MAGLSTCDGACLSQSPRPLCQVLVRSHGSHNHAAPEDPDVSQEHVDAMELEGKSSLAPCMHRRDVVGVWG